MSAERRPPLDHPVRKALYALPAVRQTLNAAAMTTGALISDLERVGVDPTTWLEVLQLRRDLRVAQAQLDHAVHASQDWSRVAASDPSQTSTAVDDLPADRSVDDPAHSVPSSQDRP